MNIYNLHFLSSCRCQDREFQGYYADPETNCQVFHFCFKNENHASLISQTERHKRKVSSNKDNSESQAHVYHNSNGNNVDRLEIKNRRKRDILPQTSNHNSQPNQYQQPQHIFDTRQETRNNNQELPLSYTNTNSNHQNSASFSSNLHSRNYQVNGGASFICPIGTIFHQRYFVCVWWYDFDCESAQRLYSQNNFAFGNPGDPGKSSLTQSGGIGYQQTVQNFNNQPTGNSHEINLNNNQYSPEIKQQLTFNTEDHFDVDSSIQNSLDANNVTPQIFEDLFTFDQQNFMSFGNGIVTPKNFQHQRQNNIFDINEHLMKRSGTKSNKSERDRSLRNRNKSTKSNESLRRVGRNNRISGFSQFNSGANPNSGHSLSNIHTEKFSMNMNTSPNNIDGNSKAKHTTSTNSHKSNIPTSHVSYIAPRTERVSFQNDNRMNDFIPVHASKAGQTQGKNIGTMLFNRDGNNQIHTSPKANKLHSSYDANNVQNNRPASQIRQLHNNQISGKFTFESLNHRFSRDEEVRNLEQSKNEGANYNSNFRRGKSERIFPSTFPPASANSYRGIVQNNHYDKSTSTPFIISMQKSVDYERPTVTKVTNDREQFGKNYQLPHQSNRFSMNNPNDNINPILNIVQNQGKNKNIMNKMVSIINYNANTNPHRYGNRDNSYNMNINGPTKIKDTNSKVDNGQERATKNPHQHSNLKVFSYQNFVLGESLNKTPLNNEKNQLTTPVYKTGEINPKENTAEEVILLIDFDYGSQEKKISETRDNGGTDNKNINRGYNNVPFTKFHSPTIPILSKPPTYIQPPEGRTIYKEFVISNHANFVNTDKKSKYRQSPNNITTLHSPNNHSFHENKSYRNKATSNQYRRSVNTKHVGLESVNNVIRKRGHFTPEDSNLPVFRYNNKSNLSIELERLNRNHHIHAFQERKKHPQDIQRNYARDTFDFLELPTPSKKSIIYNSGIVEDNAPSREIIKFNLQPVSNYYSTNKKRFTPMRKKDGDVYRGERVKRSSPIIKSRHSARIKSPIRNIYSHNLSLSLGHGKPSISRVTYRSSNNPVN